MLKSIASTDHLPDYHVTMEDDVVTFRNRKTMPACLPANPPKVSLSPDTLEKAKLAAPGWDVHLLEQEWRDWDSEPPRDPDAAFVGFCRKRFELHGRPT